MFFVFYKHLWRKLNFCIFFDLLKKFKISVKKMKLEHKSGAFYSKFKLNMKSFSLKICLFIF